jgi:hypothetical protein
LCTADHYEYGGRHHTDYRDYFHCSDAVALKRLPSIDTDCMISAVYQLDIKLISA